MGDPDPLAAIQDECNFNEYDELIVSTLPLHISKWLKVDLPRKARGRHRPAGEARRGERDLMDLEEQSGVDPVIERTCAECGTKLTDEEIKASLETGGPFLCSVHAAEEVRLDEDVALAALQQRDALDVRRLREHVDRPHRLELVAAVVHELARVRRERRRVARDVDDPLGLRLDDPAHDLL